MYQCRTRQPTQESLRLPRRRRPPRPPTNCLVLLAPAGNPDSKGLEVDVGGDAIVHLMKGGFAQQEHDLGIRRFDGAPKRVEVEQAAPRSIEAFFHAPQLFPYPAWEEQPIRLIDRREPALSRRPIERGDLEQAIAIGGPADRREKRIFPRLDIPRAHPAPLVCPQPQIPPDPHT